MKLITLIVFVFSFISASSQVEFKLNTYYPANYVVFYPEGVFWRSKINTTAKKYPIDGTEWARFYYPNQVPVTVTKGAWDSIINRLSVLETLITSNEFTTIDFDSTGLQLINVTNGKNVRVRSLIFNDSTFKVTKTDTTAKIDIRK